MPYNLIMESLNPDFQIDIKQIPVTISLILINVIVFILYVSKVLKTIPCNNTLTNGLFQTFIHANIEHLVFNMFGLLLTSRIEVQIGSKKYLGLVAIILGLDVAVETIIKQIITIPCSVGISGIIFGLLAYECFKLKIFNWMDVIGLIAMMIVPTLTNPKASLFAHGIGILIGIVVSIFY